MTQIETENYIHNLESQNQQLLALLTQLTVEMKPSRNQSKPNKLFCNYMIEWLERHSINIQENTYQEYKKNLDKYIYPYFKDQGIYLENLTSIDIEN
ncbi:MAG TPA: hypothetical protein VHT34_07985, partial [Clostridia bacterium]|nr:hypothetical protein [Clostridia bacterium]